MERLIGLKAIDGSVGASQEIMMVFVDDLRNQQVHRRVIDLLEYLIFVSHEVDSKGLTIRLLHKHVYLLLIGLVRYLCHHSFLSGVVESRDLLN